MVSSKGERKVGERGREGFVGNGAKGNYYPPNGSWRAVELGNPMFRDGLPVAGGGRVYGSRLEDGGGNAIEKWAVDDITAENGKCYG
jgi:hypothetical protein